jgi:predicted transcriptional regulator
MVKAYEAWDAKKAPGPAIASPAKHPGSAGPRTGTPYGTRALDSELATLALAPEGNRNAILNEVAFSLYQLVFAGHLDETSMQENVSAVARRIGLTTHEIIKTMGSARSAAQVKGRRDVPEPAVGGPEIEWDLPVVGPIERVVEGPSTALGGPEVDVEGEPEENPYDNLYVPRSALASLPRGEPLIEDVIDRHSYFVIAGRDQSFKSFIALDWLLCLATGRPWLGKEVVQSRVLYVVGEGAYGLEDRVRAWEYAYPHEKVLDEYFTVRRAPVNLFAFRPEFWDLLERVERERYEVIIFDTLQRMSSGAEQNSAKDAGVIVAALDQVRHASGGAVGVVAHTGKSDTDVRGSSAFEDDADIVWRVRREPGEPKVELTLDKRKDGPAEASHELFVRPIPGSGSIVLQVGDPRTEGNKTDLRKYSVEILRALTNPALDSRGVTSGVVLDAALIPHRQSFFNGVEPLIRAGWVVKLENGGHPTYKITDSGLSTLKKIDGGNLNEQ